MKNISKILMVVAISLTALNACKKKDETPKTPTKPTGVMMAKVDGKTWQSDAASSFKIVDGDTVKGITIEVENDTLRFLAVRLSDTAGVLGVITLKQPRVGTYTGDGTNGGLMIYSKPFSIDNLLSTLFAYSFTYNFNITKFDVATKKISGTFNLNMTSRTGGPGISITEGEFTDVMYKQVL
jgi:hypothetical protein